MLNTGRRGTEADASHMVRHRFHHLRQNYNAEHHNRGLDAYFKGVASENPMVKQSDGVDICLSVLSGFKRVRVPNYFVVDNMRVHEECVAAILCTHHSNQKCHYGALCGGNI